MEREVELKLEIDPAQAPLLEKHPLLRGDAQNERLISVYYDTPKRKLWRHGWTLRVRQRESDFVQTIKCAAEGAGLFDRSEWECEVQSLQPVWEHVRKTPLADLIERRQFRHLEPAFRSDVQRTTRLIENGAEKIELALDDGWIIAGGRSERVHELELEVKAGPADALLILARKFNRRVPMRLGIAAKAERGSALAEGRSSIPAKATTVVLGENATVAEGFATIVTACLKHFRLNEPIFVERHDAEALHQMRVAIRRLRTAFWLFKPIVKDAQFETLSDQLRRFTRELGAARNVDVILASMPAGDPARSQLEHDRGHLYVRITKKLSTRAFCGLMLDLLGWAKAGAWRDGKKADRRLVPFARKRLDRLWERMEGRADHLATLVDSERHKLRIDAKKMRYALEFLREPLKPSKSDQKNFSAGAEGVQDSLGRLNDLSMRQQLLPNSAWQSGSTVGSDRRERARQLRAANRCLRKMKDIGPYWRKVG